MTAFVKTNPGDFYSVLRLRVNTYFKENSLSQYGGVQLVIKTIVLLLLVFIPYGLILLGQLNALVTLALCGVMGVAFAGLGMAVMHDANHGSYSSNDNVNKFIGFFIYSLMNGGNPIAWKIQHNILHHRYTNIYGKDEDIDAYGAMRLSPNNSHRPLYRYQHIYCFVMYSFIGLMWISHKEFFQLRRYQKIGLIKSRAILFKEIAVLIVSKVFYVGYMLVIPMLMLDVTFLQWLMGFIFMHILGGLILAVVFQMAHVVDETAFPAVNKNGDIENQWAIHQMKTTANFAPQSRIMFWYIGGLNYQIEHHLFPGISHIHYKCIAEIVQKTAKEFGVPYHSNKTFFSALKSHISIMKTLGQPDTVSQPKEVQRL